MAKEEINKKQIRFLTNSASASSPCKVLTLALGKLATSSCEYCDLLLPIEPHNKYFSFSSTCLLRGESPYDSMIGIVR